ncbi:MAG: regulatory iron-sulfur-containing complex subunit RicT [Flavobacteriales bacterium]
MGCSSCSSGGSGLPGGCKNNGACGTYGCNKLEVFDWLAGMELPQGQKPFDIVEIRFKNSRKGFFRNSGNLELYAGDVVCVDVSPGFDVGVVSLTGELVKIQMKRKDIKDNYEVKKVIRKATEDDIKRWQDGRKLESTTMMRARTIARDLRLEMKLSDVEYQGDKSKATFYYTADDRVDFRELIKRYAEEFRVRIDMRQIGYRFEAGRLGGIGSCGRELCCSSWLTDFRAVSTSAARYQQLSLNPTKLAGQCGKLKCCLNFELDQYVEAMRDFPSVNTRLRLPKGTAFHFKTDIFQRIMYFIYEGQPGEAPFPLSVDSVKEILEKNKNGIEIEDFEQFLIEETVEKDTDFAEVVGQDSLTRFDKSRNRSRGGKNRGRKGDGKAPGERSDRGPRPANDSKANNPGRQERRNPSDRPKQGPPRGVNNPRNDRGPREPKSTNPPTEGTAGPTNQPKSNDNRGRGGHRNQRHRGNKGNPQGGNPPASNPPA